MDNLINPKDLIERYPLEHFNATAEQYYRSLANAELLIGKPFIFPDETPTVLRNLAALFEGLRLARTMTVLDFGAGTCWLSHILAQMQCQTISCDVSQTALDLGRKLFAEHPIVGGLIAEPVFLHFDGRRLDLPDASVDRIVCNDALHHVPNLEEVIAEMARVLKAGGIAGFNEPGRHHSRSPQAQREMLNYAVLENDIDPLEIFGIAQKHGFTDISIRAPIGLLLSAHDYGLLTSSHPIKQHLAEQIIAQARRSATNYSIFFLHKGAPIADSRSAAGLSHAISSPVSVPIQTKQNAPVPIPLRITNTGSATWLTQNVRDIGVVRVGMHLYDERGQLLDFEFGRHNLPAPVPPGSMIEVVIAPVFQQCGKYVLGIDLVAESVCWFESRGSQLLRIPVQVS